MFVQVVIDDSVTTFKFGTEIRLPCSVKGYPIPVIRWYKNNTPLPRSQRISVEEGSNTLVVKKASPIDGGTFMCRRVEIPRVLPIRANFRGIFATQRKFIEALIQTMEIPIYRNHGEKDLEHNEVSPCFFSGPPISMRAFPAT